MYCIRLILIALFLCTSFGVWAHNVVGNVVNKDRESIAYATVCISSSDNISKVVSSFLTDKNGTFHVEVSSGKYILSVQYLGYATYVDTINIEQAVQLKDIVLESRNTRLNEVVVEAKLPTVQQKIDRTVYNVQNSTVSTGRTSLELLGTAPGVWYDQKTKDLSINGVSGIKVLLNGQLLQLSGDQLSNFLESIRSEDIVKVEIITSPSAEYDASGTGGMINIITKKRFISGLYGNVNVSGSFSKYSMGTVSTSVNYYRNRWGIYGSYAFKKGAFYHFDLDEYYRILDSDFVQEGEGSTTTKGKNHSINIGTIFQLSDHQEVGVEFRYRKDTSKDKQQSTKKLTMPTLPDTLLLGVGDIHRNTPYYEALANYKIRFDTLGSELRLSGDYICTKDIEKESFNHSEYFINEHWVRDSTYRNQQPVETKIYVANADYVWKRALKVGFKYSLVDIYNPMTYEYLKQEHWITDTRYSDNYYYKESLWAGYLSLGYAWSKVEAQVGVRCEYTDLDIGNDIKTTTDSSYLQFFPSVHVGYYFNKERGTGVSVYYGRRIRRPSYTQLIPFVNPLDDYTSEQGNPDLLPEYTHVVEIKYGWRNKYLTSFSFSKTQDVFTQIQKMDTVTGRTIYQQNNLDSQWNYALSMSIPITFSSYWTSTNQCSLFGNFYSDTNFSNRQNTFYFRSLHEVVIPRIFTVEITGYFNTPAAMGNYLLKTNGGIDMGLRKNLLNNKLSIRMLGADVFNLDKNRVNIIQEGVDAYAKQKMLTQKLNISLTYKFNGKDKKSGNKVMDESQSEKNRI